MSESQPKLTRAQLRKTFKRHRGAAANLAKEIGVNKVSVSHALLGSLSSDRLLVPIRKRAAELLAMEQANSQEVA